MNFLRVLKQWELYAASVPTAIAPWVERFSELGIVHWKFAPQLHAGATLGVIVTVLLMASITTMRKRRPSTFVVLLFAIGWAAGLLLTISFRLGLAHAFPAEWAEVGYALWGAAYIVAVCCFGAFLYEAFRALGKDGP